MSEGQSLSRDTALACNFDFKLGIRVESRSLISQPSELRGCGSLNYANSAIYDDVIISCVPLKPVLLNLTNCTQTTEPNLGEINVSSGVNVF